MFRRLPAARLEAIELPISRPAEGMFDHHLLVPVCPPSWWTSKPIMSM